MNDTQALAYVQATAQAIDLPLDGQRAQAVAVHLARTAGMAALLDSVPLAPHDELVEIYCPKPFPAL